MGVTTTTASSASSSADNALQLTSLSMRSRNFKWSPAGPTPNLVGRQAALSTSLLSPERIMSTGAVLNTSAPKRLQRQLLMANHSRIFAATSLAERWVDPL